MNRNNNTLEGIGAFTVIILAIFTLVISPALSFMFAYIGGCILKFFVGDALVNGLNIIFNTTRFTLLFVQQLQQLVNILKQQSICQSINNNRSYI